MTETSHPSHDHHADKLQPAKAGVGPLYHRKYFIDFISPHKKASELMSYLKCDINKFCPQLMANFIKSRGDSQIMSVGDRYDIRLTAPWDAPVVVTQVTPNSFKFMTCEGHPEAGEIQFRIRTLKGEKMRLEIESWARSKDQIVSFLYDTVPIMKMLQTEMWRSFCQTFVEDLKVQHGEVKVFTENFDEL